MSANTLLSPCGCDNLYSIFVHLIWWLLASSGGIFCLGREFSVVHDSSAWRSRLGAMGLTGTYGISCGQYQCPSGRSYLIYRVYSNGSWGINMWLIIGFNYNYFDGLFGTFPYFVKIIFFTIWLENVVTHCWAKSVKTVLRLMIFEILLVY